MSYLAIWGLTQRDVEWTTQLSLIQQHHATLAKTELSDHHRQILHQQLDSLYRERLPCWNRDTFSRILQVIDGSGSESAQPPPIVCRAQEEDQGGGREK